MSAIPFEWESDDAWCSGCCCLVELCECPSETERDEVADTIPAPAPVQEVA